MDKGAHFYRCDFQVHSPLDANWSGRRPTGDDECKKYAADLIEACLKKGLDAIAITDHNDLGFVSHVREAASRARLNDTVSEVRPIVVYPGIELTLAVPCQAIVIFDADLPEDLFDLIMKALALEETVKKGGRKPNRRLEHIDSLAKLYKELDKHSYLRGRYIVLPNVSDGGADTLIRKGMASKYKEMPCVGGYVDGSIEKLGEGATRILEGSDESWGNKPLALFQTSDTRREDHRDLGCVTTWVKWAVPTAEALRQACLARQSRICQTLPVLPASHITAISVSNSKFLGPLSFELNPQFTALIGGRGTGKSTALEYLRWALCDQASTGGPDDEIPDYHQRRRSLIDRTLKGIEATVDVTFSLNDIRHVVRRYADSSRTMLKIGSGDFKDCGEGDVQALLPIQAYSQKQLSSVGVKVEELKRFVEAPIRDELAEIANEFDQVAAQIREKRAQVRERRLLQGQRNRERLSLASLTERAETRRTSLSGVTDSDRTVLDSRTHFELADQTTINWRDDLALAERSAKELEASIADLPRPLPDVSAFPEGEPLRRASILVEALFASLRQAAADLTSTIVDQTREGSELHGALESWAESRTTYLEKYEEAKGRSDAHAERLSELSGLEASLARTRAAVESSEAALKALRDPESAYDKLWGEWKRLHRRRAALLEQKANDVTELSGGEIRATIVPAGELSTAVDRLRVAISGSGIRAAKVDRVRETVASAEDPISQWLQILDELGEIATIDPADETTIDYPATPTLSQCGITPTEIDKLARRLSDESWLDLALEPLEDRPVFEYRVGEGRYIPFEDASAGQQATALLEILLGLPGPPLIIDQPEDDVDSQVILEIVEQVWQAKKKRQLIFASHNANLVVNGDAELVICFDYRVTGDHSGGRVASEGAIDVPGTRDAIKQVIEGGEEAFLLRRDKYGF